MLTGLFKDATFGPFSNLHTCISLVEVYRFGQCLVWRFSPISTFFSLVSSRAFRSASHSRFWCRDPKLCLLDFLKVLHLCISLGEVYRFGQCLDWRFLPISTFLSVVSSRAFRDAPHSRFRCGDPNQCLPNLLKMLLLSLPQIYTRVFHVWKSIALDSAWVRDSRLYQLSFLW